jgi:hypothetical protein
MWVAEMVGSSKALVSEITLGHHWQTSKVLSLLPDLQDFLDLLYFSEIQYKFGSGKYFHAPKALTK